MKLEKNLLDFLKNCYEKLRLKGIIQFGSSTYSKNAHDIDLIFFSKDDVVSADSFLELINLIKKFETKHSEFVFDFGGPGRKRKVRYEVTIVFLGLKELEVKYNPHDIFFHKNLTEDENVRVLFGENAFKKSKFNLTNQHLFEMLSVDMKHALRQSFDDEEEKFNAVYHLFKTVLRAMLINDEVFKKEELLEKFKSKYPKINLPKNSERILANKINEEDFEEILKFAEDCLRCLVK